MNLPQRKKSAEELAKLREELGVFAQPPAPQAISAAPAPAPRPQGPPQPDFLVPPPAPSTLPPVEQLPTPGLNPLPAAAPRLPKPVTSLRKSERIPVLPAADEPPPFQPVSAPPHGPVVRSLRKSEQGPVIVPKPDASTSASSHLPAQRHTDQTLNEIRRRDALNASMAPPPPKLLAPLPLIILAYLAASAGGFLPFFELGVTGPVVCESTALALAAFIFLKKTQSRHHAALIFIIALFVIVFGTIHYVPQFRYVP